MIFIEIYLNNFYSFEISSYETYTFMIAKLKLFRKSCSCYKIGHIIFSKSKIKVIRVKSIKLKIWKINKSVISASSFQNEIIMFLLLIFIVWALTESWKIFIENIR